ncbi:hypothetical protein AFLA_008566 [Aspergillus flavus NRRL3357]|nr:hypothetical protein AFLA_008566 [Aspergillus flavus NRRL3357]
MAGVIRSHSSRLTNQETFKRLILRLIPVIFITIRLWLVRLCPVMVGIIRSKHEHRLLAITIYISPRICTQ